MQSLRSICDSNIKSLEAAIARHEAVLSGKSSVKDLERWWATKKRIILLHNCDKTKCVENIKGVCTCAGLVFSFKDDKVVCDTMSTEGVRSMRQHVDALKKELESEKARMKKNLAERG